MYQRVIVTVEPWWGETGMIIGIDPGYVIILLDIYQNGPMMFRYDEFIYC